MTTTEQEPLEEERTWWDFDADGDVDGVFVRAGTGHTQNGKRPFLELTIDGSARTVWLHHSALVSKFRDRVKEHGPIQEGERIVIRKKPEQKTSAEGRDYYVYDVEFPDLPQADQFDVFGAERSETTTEPKPDGDIPF